MTTEAALARSIRNESDYDDWEYGTEPLPNDPTWVQPKTLDQLLAKVTVMLQASETVNTEKLAWLAIDAVLRLQPQELEQLRKQAGYS